MLVNKFIVTFDVGQWDTCCQILPGASRGFTRKPRSTVKADVSGRRCTENKTTFHNHWFVSPHIPYQNTNTIKNENFMTEKMCILLYSNDACSLIWPQLRAFEFLGILCNHHSHHHPPRSLSPLTVVISICSNYIISCACANHSSHSDMYKLPFSILSSCFRNFYRARYHPFREQRRQCKQTVM